MVAGIVTLVEGEALTQVAALRALLEEAVGAPAVRGSRVPHLSYHVAQDYDLPAVDALFARLGAETAPFQVRTPGLLFLRHGVWLEATRPPQLTALQDALWDEASTAGTGVEQRYHRDRWAPHVTLAERDPGLEFAPALRDAFHRELVPAAMTIANIALIEETDTGHDILRRTTLAGAGQGGQGGATPRDGDGSGRRPA